MNTPITLELKVSEHNYTDSTPILAQDTYVVHVTLQHKIHHLQHSIWRNSPNFQLKPIFFKITDSSGTTLPDSTFEELLGVLEPPQEPVTQFELRIDYTMYGSPYIPARDPEEELFDIYVVWTDTRGHDNKVMIRELLQCTVDVLKEYIADQRNQSFPDSEPVDGSYFDLRYEGEILRDNSKKLLEVMGLDVTPLEPLQLQLLYVFARGEDERDSVTNTDSPASNHLDSNNSGQEPTSVPRSVRFLVKINSDVSNLQQESSLFEVNHRTSLREFVNQIIERADQYQVRRTFFDQVKLKYNGELITLDENYSRSVLNVLHLTEEALVSSRVVNMDLNIHSHLSGVEGGILSREFWHDLTSETRFQFYPTIRDDLAPHMTDDDGTESHIDVTDFEGQSWRLVGNTYEQITNGSRTELAHIRSLDTVEYSFKLRDRVVTLTSSQCMVVDTGTHRPYLLVNRSGAAKLREFDSMLEYGVVQSTVVDFEDEVQSREAETGNGIPNADSPATIPLLPTPTREAPEPVQAPEPAPEPVRQQHYLLSLFQLISWVYTYLRTRPRDFYFNIGKVVLLVFLFSIDKLVALFWKYLIVWVLVVVPFIMIFVKSETTADLIEKYCLRPSTVRRPAAVYHRLAEAIVERLRSIEDTRVRTRVLISTRAIQFAVVRKRDYEILLAKFNRQDTVRFYLQLTAVNFLKDICLGLVTIVYSSIPAIQRAVEAHRSSLNADLEGDIEKLYDEFVRVRKQYEAQIGPYDLDFDIEAIREYLLVRGNENQENETQDEIQDNVQDENQNQNHPANDVQAEIHDGNPDDIEHDENDENDDLEDENQPENQESEVEESRTVEEEREIQYQIFLAQLLRLQGMVNECKKAIQA